MVASVIVAVKPVVVADVVCGETKILSVSVPVDVPVRLPVQLAPVRQQAMLSAASVVQRDPLLQQASELPKFEQGL
jgi:hypothetical protein